jgi:Response regulator containing CheY-like receiver, AAA-type ATPase, and DNA-binding domains
MSSQALSEIEASQEQVASEGLSESNMDDKINILRDTVLQLLQEVESLTIAAPAGLKSGARLDEEVRQFEMSLIRTALGKTAGSQTRAAKLLGLKLTTLNAKIKRYHITPNGYQAGFSRTAQA